MSESINRSKDSSTHTQKDIKILSALSLHKLLPIFILIIGMLVGSSLTLLMYYKNLKLREKQSSTITANDVQTGDKDLENSESKEQIELTGFFYIGPKEFQLVYEYDQKKEGEFAPTTGSYVLHDYDNKEKYILREEPYNGCGFDTILKSTVAGMPDNIARFLVNYSCGDAPKHILLGIRHDTTKSNYEQLPPKLYYEAIESKNINLGDSYYAPQTILGWITSSEILVRESIRDPGGVQPLQTKYWKVNIDNPTRRDELQI